jgi:N-acetylneuraminic acid mutarotase
MANATVNSNTPTSKRRSKKTQVKAGSFRLSRLRVVLFLGLMATLFFSYSARHLTTTNAQQQKSTGAFSAASLPQAQAQGQIETVAKTAQPSEPTAQPEGGSCTWSASTVYPVTILDQATASVGGTIYTFGGVSTAIFANAYKFDGTTWTAIAPLPASVEFPTAVSDGTNVYILGGALVGTGAPQTTLYRYNVATNDYTTLAPFSTGTWNQAAAYLNGKIYKFAGTGASASVNNLEIYDVAGNSWTAGAPYPLAISFVSAFARGNFVYAAGGIQSVGSAASLKTYRYDPAGNTWDDAAIADLPLTRWGAASSGVGYGSNNGWVLAGGYENGTATANIANTVIRWDPVGNTWASLPNMLGERSRMTGAILNSRFYVIGGRSVASPNFVGTNDNQSLLCVSNVAVVTPGTVTITAEGCGTPNNSPDPGETLTVALPITNAGDTATTNLTVTLQATGGVTNPSAPQNYGAVLPGGPAVTRNFTFTVDPNTSCGGQITLTWTIADGATNYPNATKSYTTGTRSILMSENFDGVTAPALPAGWSTTQTSGTGITWNTVTDTVVTAPNAAFANDPATVNASALVSPAVAINTATAQLSFKNKYITEATFDGEVLEYSTDGGTNWTDVITGGGTFVSGGYNGPISTGFMSPIGGRQAWSGTSAGGYIDTVVNLPASLNGQSVKFRWLMASDSSQTVTGVWVDNVQIVGDRVCTSCGGGPASKARADFDGDGKSDISVVRDGGSWYLLRSTAGFTGIAFGTSGDVAVPGDYDGDGKTDEAVVRGGNTWYILRSTAGFTGVSFGLSGDIPVVRDYDGDGKADIAVYRPSNNTWYVLQSSNGAVTSTTWGVSGDIPVAGDFDGDGKGDQTVFRPSTGSWIINKSSGGNTSIGWGLAGDKLVPGDYDGDHKDDVAVFRGGNWYILTSTGNTISLNFGLGTDKAVPADYDGDGKTDIAVFRDGNWYIQGSAPGAITVFSAVQFGIAGDKAVPAAYVPEQ